MKKTFYFKSFILLCTLLVGVVNAHAVVYQWTKVTNLSEVQTDDIVAIVDESQGIALPNTGGDFQGVAVTCSDNIITSTVSDNIQWILTKNGDSFKFKRSDGTLLYGDSAPGVQRLLMRDGNYTTSVFYFDDYDSGGKLNFENMASGQSFYYVYWVDQKAEVTSDKSQAANITLYKMVEIPSTVKWKLVDGDNVSLDNNDVVVIVDLTTGLAMSNDKESKAPDGVAVELNYDKDRILGEVPENVQWTYKEASGGYKFANGDDNLYADSKGLKVGTGADNVFDLTTIEGTDSTYLHIAISGTDYFAGVEKSMMSNSWKLKEAKEGKPDSKVKDTKIAFFRRVEDGQTIPTVEFAYENYEINAAAVQPNRHMVRFDKATASGDYQIGHYSSNGNVFGVVDENDTWSPNPNGDWLVLFKSGTAQLIARIEETEDHDKAVTTCTIRYNNRYEDQQRKKGSRTYPLLPSEAIKLAKGEPVEGALDYDPDRCYFIKGKVNKVNSGLLSMFGDLGLDEMMGDDMDMDERMGDLDDFDMGEMGDMGGADLSTMIPGLSGSDGLTYYISDDGSKVDRLKVSNGRGLVIHESAANAVTFEKLEDLSPGDDVLVYGPIVVSEDNNLFSSLFTSTGGIGQQQGGGSSEYEWVPISLDDLCTDDVVLLVDKYETIALNSDLKGTTVTIRGDKIADGVSTNTQWTLTKNEGGTVTFKMGNNPLSVTSNLTLTVGQGQSSEFTYYDGLLGIEYPNNKRYCIKWKEADGGYSAIFENIEAAYGNTEADFTFYKRVLKEEEVEEEEEDDNRTVKVGELNYLQSLTKTLLVTDQHLYVEDTKSLTENQDFFYTLNQTPEGTIDPAKVKSSDEEIAKWVYTDEQNTDSLFTGVKAGNVKVTVKVKVIVAPEQGDTGERSYTMKRKFQLEVRSRDKEPEGKNVGEYVLINSVDELEDGTRMLIVGTRTKDEEKTHYGLSSNNSMMGGGKGGTKIGNDSITINNNGRECIKYEDVPDGVQEIILEKETVEGESYWYLNVGEDENGDKLYLYASDSTEEEETTEEEESSGFDISQLLDMFMPSSGLKVATKEAVGDSCRATINISSGIATIQFPSTEGKKTIIKLASAFDMDGMMDMFGSGDEEENTGGDTGSQSSNGKSYDFFMASFNTKPADDDKGIMPRIFGFVHYDEYPITIGTAEWMTIVSDYDVTPKDGVEVYVVTEVTQDQDQNKATLVAVESLKGGEPYLLHSTSGEYTMMKTSNVSKPDVNLLAVSDGNTSGVKGNTSVYVLANKTKGVGFYKWVGGQLGAGRVYLPVGFSVEGAAGFCTFFEDIPTVITDINLETISNDRYYDLQGRRVLKPTKGVYVVDGKKVIVK